MKNKISLNLSIMDTLTPSAEMRKLNLHIQQCISLAISRHQNSVIIKKLSYVTFPQFLDAMTSLTLSGYTVRLYTKCHLRPAYIISW